MLCPEGLVVVSVSWYVNASLTIEADGTDVAE